MNKEQTRLKFAVLIMVSGWMTILSCNVINPAEPVPVYFQIDSIRLKTEYLTQGSATAKIPDTWVFVDNEYLGTYGLPVTFPALGEGIHKISFRAGVQVNGMAENRAAYPPFGVFDTTLKFEAGAVVHLNPSVVYKSGTVFKQIEDFDDGSLSLISTSSSMASLNISPVGDANAYENNSGFVILDDNHPQFEVASSDTFTLPYTVPVYVELNYKTDHEFTLGVFVSGSSVIQSPLVNVRPTATWKKIYVNISQLGGVLSGNVFYKIFLKGVKSSSQSTATFYFDNLKVLY